MSAIANVCIDTLAEAVGRGQLGVPQEAGVEVLFRQRVVEVPRDRDTRHKGLQHSKRRSICNCKEEGWNGGRRVKSQGRQTCGAPCEGRGVQATQCQWRKSTTRDDELVITLAILFNAPTNHQEPNSKLWTCSTESTPHQAEWTSLPTRRIAPMSLLARPEYLVYF